MVDLSISLYKAVYLGNGGFNVEIGALLGTVAVTIWILQSFSKKF